MQAQLNLGQQESQATLSQLTLHLLNDTAFVNFLRMTGKKMTRLADEQINGFLRQAQEGMQIEDNCWTGGFSQTTFFK